MTLAIIPTRMGSTRFPAKVLADRTGKPLIQHVVETAMRAKSLDRIIVAGDDPRIIDAVEAFGGEAMMTRADHPNGSSRLAEVIGKLDARGVGPDDIVVNVQGDEPEIEPSVIDELVAKLKAEPSLEKGGAHMATLASDFAPDEDPADPNIVKLVVNQNGHAMYFSRSLIPCIRDADGPIDPSSYLKHPGLYAYRRSFLARYPSLAPTPMELAEKLEQLRVLEHGYRIAVAKTSVRHHGIDTPEQYDAFVERYLAKG